MESLASIQNIKSIRKIEGADRIMAATVLGYQTVIKAGEFTEGSLCVFHAPDTILPNRPEYAFLEKQNFRLKVSRFKGQISQGLAMPMNILPSTRVYWLGDDVTDIVGIKKYEKPIPAQLAGTVKGPFPTWLRKTDEPNLRSFPSALDELIGLECAITQKVDGSSATFYLKDGQFGVCSRNLELLEDCNNSLWKCAKELKIAEALSTLNGDFALQGEIHGEGIQGNPLKIKGVTVRFFNLFDIQKHEYVGYERFVNFCHGQSLPIVKLIELKLPLDYNLDQLVALANEQEYGPGLPAEGIVIRPAIERYSPSLAGRLSVKVISEKYALKHGE